MSCLDLFLPNLFLKQTQSLQRNIAKSNKETFFYFFLIQILKFQFKCALDRGVERQNNKKVRNSK